MKKYFFLLFFFLVLRGQALLAQSITASKGVLDLRKDKSIQNKVLVLDGEWEFYYQGFLTKNQFDTLSKKHYRNVPIASWHEEQYDGKPISSQSYASYRLTILLPFDCPQKLALRSYEQSSAFVVFVNGKRIGGLGEIATSVEDAIPQTGTFLEDFSLDTSHKDTLEIIIHISNYHHRKAGLWHTLWFGKETLVREQKTQENYLTIFLLGGLLLMAFYHFILFTLRPKDTSTLYFSLSCALMGLRLSTTGDVLLTNLFPTISWEIKYKIEYLSLFIGLPMIVIFIRDVFPQEYSWKAIRIFLIINILFIIFPLFVPVSIYSHIIPYFYILILIGIGLGLYGIVKAVLNRRKGAVVFLIGCFALIYTSINDILFSSLVINTFYMVPWGFFIFFFSQATLLSIRFSGAFNEIEKLSTELQDINIGLEQTVEERSKEILNTNAQLQQTIEELNANLDIIHTQKVEITKKNKDLTDSLKYAKRIQEAVLPDLKDIHENLKEFFVYYQPREIVSGDFYYFAKIQDKMIVAAVDCTGHGVPGAFMSLIGKEMLDKIVYERQVTSPELILQELHIGIRTTLKQAEKDNRDGMDIGMAVIDFQQKVLEFAGAKNRLYFNQNNHWGEIKGDKYPIGGLQKEEKRAFTKHTLSIATPTTIYLFSDGFQDQFGGEEGRKFLSKNFRLLLQNLQDLPLRKQKEELQHTMQRWLGDKYEPLDDILVLGVRV